MHRKQYIVDDRAFLVGLDGLYRKRMKQHERGELLGCARSVAAALNLMPSDGPVEGYYTEDARLTEYFRLMRAIQGVDASAAPKVADLSEFQRLREVTTSPLFGRILPTDRLLPAVENAMSAAVRETYPDWSVARIVSAAGRIARTTDDDISLVGLAARFEDAVVLAAVRESAVLYLSSYYGASEDMLREPEFLWQVDDELAGYGQRFVDTFNALFGDWLPSVQAASAEQYWYAAVENRIAGRCACLGWGEHAPGSGQMQYYHWAIDTPSLGPDGVHDFWQPELWTSERYMEALSDNRGRRPDLFA